MLAFYPYHPLLVHFPVALGLSGVFFLTWGILRDRPRWTEYGRTTLLLGWLGLLAAAASGLVDQSRAPDRLEVSSTINQHITVAIALIVVFGLALYWPLRNRALFSQANTRRAYVLLLVVGVALIFLEGWLGGRLVYELGVGVAAH